VVLGGGKRLFDDRDGHRMGLRLVDSTTTEGGLLLLTYHTRTGGQPEAHRIQHPTEATP
jgi:hypothetical protein